MKKIIIDTLVWCVLGSGVAYTALPGILAIVGAVVAPIVIIIHTIVLYLEQKKGE